MKYFWNYFLPAFFLFLFYPEQSIFSIDELNEASPEYIEASYKKAIAEFDMRNYEDSLNQIRHVIKADMNNYNLRYLAAHNHWKSGNFDSAALHFQAAINVRPEAYGTYIDFALMRIHERKYRSAEFIAQNGIKYLSQHNIPVPPKIYNILSRIKLQQGLSSEALVYAEMAKAALNTNTGIKDNLESVVLESRAQLSLNNFEKAELAMQWAISLKENSPYLQNLMGYIYKKWSASSADEELKKKYVDQAKKYFQLALENALAIDEFKVVVQKNMDSLQP